MWKQRGYHIYGQIATMSIGKEATISTTDEAAISTSQGGVISTSKEVASPRVQKSHFQEGRDSYIYKGKANHFQKQRIPNLMNKLGIHMPIRIKPNLLPL
jgi:hypothetical protein